MYNFTLEQIVDVSYIVDVNLNYYHKKMGYPLENLDTSIKKLNNKFNNGLSFGLYLKDNDNIIGYIQYELYDSNDLFRKADTSIAISDLYLDEKYRGLELSKFLTNQTIVTDYLKETLPLKNYGLFTFIDLENESSMYLHLKSNFKIYKEELDMYGEDKHAYVLYKSLDDNNLYDQIKFDNFEILDKYLNVEYKEFKNIHNINTNIEFKINCFEEPFFNENFKKLYEKLEYLPIDTKLSLVSLYNDLNNLNKHIDSSCKKMQHIAKYYKESLNEDIYNEKGRLVLKLDDIEYTFFPNSRLEHLEEFINDYKDNELDAYINDFN